MNGGDCARTRRDRLDHPLRIDIERVWRDVHEHRQSARARNCRCRRYKRNRRDNYLVAGFDIQKRQGEFQRHCAVTCADAMPAMLICREALLEFADEWMEASPLRAVENSSQ